MRAELAAVIAGTDRDDALPAGSIDAGPHRLRYGWSVDAIDDDLEHRVHSLGQVALGNGAERRAKSVIGRGDHGLRSSGPHLTATPDHTAGKRQKHAG